MVETEEFLQPALTHTRTHCRCRSLTHTHALMLVCAHRARTLVLSTPTSTSPLPPYYAQQSTHTHRHIQSHTRIFVIFIFSFRLLAWRFLIAMISFHLCFNFISFQTRARTLSLHLACADCSLNAIGLAYTAPTTTQRHTQIEQVACNQ